MIIILSIALVASLGVNVWQWLRGPRQFNINLSDPNNAAQCVRKGDTVMVTLGNGYVKTKGVMPDAASFTGPNMDDFFGRDMDK